MDKRAYVFLSSAWQNSTGFYTKRVILEMYDQMAVLPRINAPHPKGPARPPSPPAPLPHWRGEQPPSIAAPRR